MRFYMAENTVNALFIPLSGIPFPGNANSPAKSFIQLTIRNRLTDYVFFGDLNNRLIYHEVDYNNKNLH